MGTEVQIASLSLLDPRPAFERAWRYFVTNDAQIHLSRLPGLDLEKLKQSPFFEKLGSDSILTLKGPCTIDLPPGSVAAFIVRTMLSAFVGISAVGIFAKHIRAAVDYYYPTAKREEILSKALMAAFALLAIAGTATFYLLGTTFLCNARIYQLKLS